MANLYHDSGPSYSAYRTASPAEAGRWGVPRPLIPIRSCGLLADGGDLAYDDTIPGTDVAAQGREHFRALEEF